MRDRNIDRKSRSIRFFGRVVLGGRYRIKIARALAVVALCLGTTSGFAQGVFLPIGIPYTAIETGHTELAGAIQLALSFGTTLADVIVVDPSPFQITNASATDIRITAAGSLSTGVPTIDSTANLLRIPINAGGSTGSLRIEGLRLSVNGATASSVPVRVFFEQSQNVMLSSDPVPVIDSFSRGLSAAEMTDQFLIVNNRVLDATATIPVAEVFAAAFSSGSEFGQSGGTQIRIKVSDFPSGLRMLFPASVTADETAATLTTLEGTNVELPRTNGGREVNYVFAQAADSAQKVESFNIVFSVSVVETVDVRQPTIEVSLAPIGAAVPTTALPSAAVPRFSEDDILVLAGSSRTVSKRFYWPGLDATLENRITLVNTGNQSSRITVEGLGADGIIISDVSLLVASNESWTQSTESLFGSLRADLASVRVLSTEEAVLAMGTSFAVRVEEAVELTDYRRAGFTIPATSGEARLSVLNTDPDLSSEGVLELRNNSGASIAVVPTLLGPLASSTATVTDIFDGAAGDYVVGRFNRPIAAALSSQSSESLATAPRHLSVGKPTLIVPFATSGGAYDTLLKLVNTSIDTATLTATLVTDTSTDSQTITLRSGESQALSLTDLFGGSGKIRTGYLRLDVEGIRKAIFTIYPVVTGYAEIRRTTPEAITRLPLLTYASESSTLINTGSGEDRFTGIAVINAGSVLTTVTLNLQDAAGVFIEQQTLSLGPGAFTLKLLSEIFAVAVPENAVLGISADNPVYTGSTVGSLDGETLYSVPVFP